MVTMICGFVLLIYAGRIALSILVRRDGERRGWEMEREREGRGWGK